MRTPWGSSQTQKKLGDGVVEVTTASHGGIHLDATRNALVHHAWRNKGGWYEEDEQWAIAAVTFPNLFTAERVIAGHRAAKDWCPDQYERVFGVTLLPAESYQRREDLFQKATADKFVATAAWGYRNNWPGRVPVPEGMVGVVARRGTDGAERWVLVSEAEYAGGRRFVVDEQRHAEWPETAPAIRLVVNTAWNAGSVVPGRAAVPYGMVGVAARVGGRDPGAQGNPERWFLVPADEYRAAWRGGFVIDEQRHAEWPAGECPALVPVAGQRVDVGWSGGLVDVTGVEDGRVVGEFYGEIVRVPLDMVRSIHDGDYVKAA